MCVAMCRDIAIAMFISMHINMCVLMCIDMCIAMSTTCVQTSAWTSAYLYRNKCAWACLQTIRCCRRVSRSCGVQVHKVLDVRCIEIVFGDATATPTREPSLSPTWSNMSANMAPVFQLHAQIPAYMCIRMSIRMPIYMLMHVYSLPCPDVTLAISLTTAAEKFPSTLISRVGCTVLRSK